MEKHRRDGNQWAKKMPELLNRMHRERKAFKREGQAYFTEETIAAFERRYAELIRKGRKKQEDPASLYERRREGITELNRKVQQESYLIPA
ncbi:MAG: hypothetical protein ACLVD1_14445 [Lacrimispora saccharolytica]